MVVFTVCLLVALLGWSIVELLASIVVFGMFVQAASADKISNKSLKSGCWNVFQTFARSGLAITACLLAIFQLL